MNNLAYDEKSIYIDKILHFPVCFKYLIKYYKNPHQTKDEVEVADFMSKLM